MPVQYMVHYNSEYLAKVKSVINQTSTLNTKNYDQVQMTFRVEPSLPKNIDLEELDTERKVMNKIMMNYVD